MTPGNPAFLAFRRLRFHARIWLGGYPSAFLPLMRIRKRRSDGAQAVGPRTRVVLEGFPRSANTFALLAFRRSQPEPMHIAHHLHAPAQIIEGVRRGIPTLLLLRDPVDAIPSLIQRDALFTPSLALRYYVDFHRRVLPFVDQVLVAPFHCVISDFGAVIHRLNEKYGTDFTTFHHTQANQQACFDEIERMNRDRFGNGRKVIEAGVARPSDWRASKAEGVRSAFLEGTRCAQLSYAKNLYQTFLEHAQSQMRVKG